MPTTPYLGIEQVSANQTQKEVTINDAILQLEAATNGTFNVDYTGVLSKTLSVDNYTGFFIFVAGAATADAILQYPSEVNGNPTSRLVAVRNTTGFGLTVKADTGTGTTVVIPNGEARLLAMVGEDTFIAAEPGIAVAFLGLSDVPHSYTGKAGQALVATPGEDGLVFVALVKTLAAQTDVTLATPANGQVLTYQSSSGKWINAALPSVVTSFLGLTDTPDAYTGQANNFIRVNGAATGVEFIAILQVPADGTDGQVLTHGTGSAYSWADATGGGSGVPAGGTIGQVLTKLSSTDGDADWADPTGGGGGSGPAGFEVIDRIVLSSAGGTITFAGIPDTFDDLFLVVNGRTSNSAIADLRMQFNGDTGNNYDFIVENRFGTANGNAVASMRVGDLLGTTAPADYPTSNIIEIPEYTGTTFFQATASGDEVASAQTGAGMFRQSNGGWWRSKTAVTDILLFPSAGNFVAGTVATLYGRGGVGGGGGGGDGSGLPDGGTTGQFLAKASDTDGDADWVNAPEGSVPNGGTTGQLLAKASDTDGDAEWVDPPEGGGGDGVPDGGNTGQVLTKASDGDGDAVWADQSVGDGLYRFGSFFTTSPLASEVLLLHTATDDFTLAANFGGSSVKVGVNPTAAWVGNVSINGTNFGTVSISTSGVVTFASTLQDVNAGDVLAFTAPASADITIASVAFTFRGVGQFIGNGGTAGAPVAIEASTVWRVRGNISRDPTQGIGFAEVKLLDGTATNLITGGSVIYSSFSTSNGFAPAEAFDGSTASGNGWYSSNDQAGGVNAWIGYIFPSAVLPVQVSVCPLNSFPNTFPTIMWVEFLDANGIWQQAGQFALATGVNDTYQTYTLQTLYVPVNSPFSLWSGKTLGVIGDSIVDQAPGGVRWSERVKSLLGFGSLSRDGVSGSVMASAAARVTALNMNQIDVLLISLGTNDYGDGSGTALGAVGDDVTDATFAGYIQDTIKAAMTANPLCRIAFMTPIQRGDKTAANTQGKVLRDYCDMIIAVAAEYGVPVLDMNRRGGINQLNIPTMLTTDHLHPVGLGQAYMGRVVAGWLQGV